MQSRAILLTIPFGLLAGCLTPPRKPADPPLVLRVESKIITVERHGDGYFGTIGFVFINNSGNVISQAGCRTPGSPLVEKRVNGEWVVAYYPIYFACRTRPDFTWEPRVRLRDTVRFFAFQGRRGAGPELRVDSVDGVYRLHWSFTEGRDATAKGAKRYDVVSNEFQLVVSSVPPQASNTR
jgi:hypothetical protein